MGCKLTIGGGYPEGTSGQNHSNVWNDDPDSFPNDQSAESIVFHERLQLAIAKTLRPAITRGTHGHHHVASCTADNDDSIPVQAANRKTCTRQQNAPPAEIRHLYDVQRNNRTPAGPNRQTSSVARGEYKAPMTHKMIELRRWKTTRAQLQKCNTVDEVMNALYKSLRKSLSGGPPANAYYDKKLQAEAVAQLIWFAYSSYSDIDTRSRAKIYIEQIFQMRTMIQPGGYAEPRQTSLPGLLNSQTKAVRNCAA